MNSLKLLGFALLVSKALSDSSSCGDWQLYENEKCIKIFDKEKLLTYEEAEKSCSLAENGSYLITIHSKEEQDFVSDFLFGTNGLVENIWLGLKNKNNNFKWIDGSILKYANWENGSPSKEPNHDCVQMVADSHPKGKWVDEPCIKKNIAVCQKNPTITLSLLQKIILKNNKEIKERINNILSNLFSNQWINFKLFTDSDGKQKAFILPLNENKEGKTWDEAVNICAKFNATLVKIDSWQKQFIFQSYLGQLGTQGTNMLDFWINGQRDSSGKWKYVDNGKEITYTNWWPKNPHSDKGSDYLAVELVANEDFGKIFNLKNDVKYHVVCELDVYL